MHKRQKEWEKWEGLQQHLQALPLILPQLYKKPRPSSATHQAQHKSSHHHHLNLLSSQNNTILPPSPRKPPAQENVVAGVPTTMPPTNVPVAYPPPSPLPQAAVYGANA
ncbi:hypothetical protein ACLOJK_038326 [Asimina triloba]